MDDDSNKPRESFELESSDASDNLLFDRDAPNSKPLRWQTPSDRRARGWKGLLQWAGQKTIALIRKCLTWHFGCVILCTIIAWWIAYQYSKHTFWRDPESYFYRKDDVYELKYSKHRRSQALHYINANSEASAQPYVSAANPVICIGIVTVKRKQGMDYLNSTIGSMLTTLTDEERSTINVQVLFADMDPAKHPEWDRAWLKNTIDHYGTYNVSDEQFNELKEWYQKENYQTKGVYDYNYILEQCLNHTTAPYIAVFEDDLIFAEGWLAKTMSAMRNIRRESTNWLYLRLFYVDRFGRWPGDPWYTNPVPWMWLTILSICAITLGLSAAWRRRYPESNTTVLVTVGCVTIPMFIILLGMIGKNSLTPDAAEGWRRMDQKGCCTQALIFPRHMVPGMIEHLREKVRGQTDLLLEKWANEMKFARFAVVPQVVQHIGLISTRGMPKKVTQTVWAFFFEASSAEKLRQEHEELAKWGIYRATTDQ